MLSCRRLVPNLAHQFPKLIPPTVSFDLNPTSREVLQMLIDDGRLATLLGADIRIHQTGCNGCIGMGQAPAIGRNSLRTTPRNFPGRFGAKEDSVFLCSPEIETASALAGCIADPRKIGIPYPERVEPASTPELSLIERRPPPAEAERVVLEMSANRQRLLALVKQSFRGRPGPFVLTPLIGSAGMDQENLRRARDSAKQENSSLRLVSGVAAPGEGSKCSP